MSTRKVKVLDLREDPSLGGINRGLFTTVHEIRSRVDVEVTYCVLARQPAGWLFERARAEGVDIRWVPCVSPLDLGVLPRLHRLIQDGQYDIVHTRGYRGDLYVRALKDLRLLNLPLVITKHGVQSSHHWRMRLYAWLDHRPLRLADRVVAVDSATHRMLLAWRVPRSRIRLIPNAAPSSVPPNAHATRSPRQDLGLSSDATVLLFAGRLEREKGVYELLAAHTQLQRKWPKLVTIIVGSGSCGADLQAVSRGIGASQVWFTGPQLRVDDYLQAADIVVLPSYKEGMPNILLEAMAAGKPIVATRVGGIPDLILHEVNGLLVKARDVRQLVDAIDQLLCNPPTAARLGHNGAARAAEAFSAARMVDRIVKEYREVGLS